MDSILSVLGSPVLHAAIIGSFVPWLYAYLQKEVGFDVPQVWKVWLNLGISVSVSMIPVAVQTMQKGAEDPELFVSSLLAAFSASVLRYETLKAKTAPAA